MFILQRHRCGDVVFVDKKGCFYFVEAKKYLTFALVI